MESGKSSVVLSDILSHVGNPMALLKNVLHAIKDDGLIYINIVNYYQFKM